MSLEDYLNDLVLNDEETKKTSYRYINVFKNPSKMPINQIHLEMNSFQLKRELPDVTDLLEMPAKDVKNSFYDKKSEVIPALDKRWLPKCVLYKFEPYSFHLSKEENAYFLIRNIYFLDSLEYLLKCDFHQFWCTILFEPSAVICLRSYILNPIPSHEAKYLDGEFANLYKRIFNAFVRVYERLITFKVSEIEYMTEDYGFKVLIDNKLLNLPIVNTLSWLYKSSHLTFVNKLTNLYFNNTSQLEILMKEIDETIKHSVLVLEMIGGYVCGFGDKAVVVPIAIPPKPKIFSLSWVYSVVTYLLNTVALLNTLLQFYKPAVEICLEKNLPFRIPFTYVNIYRDIYESLYEREEVKTQPELSDKVFDAINLGRSEFIDLFHVFISYCLDKTLEYMDNSKQQEQIVEVYIKLLSTALEDEYFICDYDQKYNVASQNEVFESCSSLDNTRTQFITSCINKLPRHKKLEELSLLNGHTIEEVFKKFKPPEIEPEPEPALEEPTSSSTVPSEKEIDGMIKDILDMFPHLGDGFVLQCLEAYDYKSGDVINAILEENLPPHLYEIPFDSIRIPPEPEPEKPILAYRGKKPDYEDAMSLLNDKEDVKKIKNFVMEGVLYSNDYLYDDEYDDRDDDDIPIKVADNPLGEEIMTFNPNHREAAESETSSSEEEEGAAGGSSKPDKSKNFCQDPAELRAQREAKFRAKQSQRKPQQQQPKANVVGKAKGQGQEKDVLKARHNKGVNKSSKANHSRKSGAQWKRSRGMVPM